MIRHIVFFSVPRPEDRKAVLEGLALLTRIPHPLCLEIAENLRIDPFDNTVDVVVYGEFANQADLEAYKAHPLYAESIRRVRPLRELRVAADTDGVSGIFSRKSEAAAVTPMA
ncbi:Dabb family protein [Chthonobacter albigriseus]|uniref:Dabb family protein n=1 Tax=Chthonobacter albigriseus TaxID=1683161 RepID=UPI0015EED0AB|nr:Dabb family protein [Chthonobacter albigriseus]